MQARTGSVYVPIDSWVYPAIQRLTLLSGTSTSALGMRPWTRAQCAAIVESAAKKFPPESQSDEAKALVEELRIEFADEIGEVSRTAKVESVYSRVTQISGTPLRDSYHYGQTIRNDYGRPYGDGTSAVAGASEYAVAGPVFGYIRGEVQRSPETAGMTPALTSYWSARDHTPVPPGSRADSGSASGRLVEAYAGVQFGRFAATFGKQSLWWGPSQGGAFLMSNNAEPMYMARLTNTEPFRLPILGDTRIDFFVSKVSGHISPAQPYLHGEKISFQPVPSLEVGFSRTTMFLGQGHGATPRRIWNSYFSVGDHAGETIGQDPGDRKGGLDIAWRLPKLPVTIYSDSFTDDDPSPLAGPARAALNPGIYIARVPGIPKLDLRAEAAYTDVPNILGNQGTFIYYNSIYAEGYTNKGQLIGNPVGRVGKSVQLWSTYWFTPRNKLQLSYRGEKIGAKFLPGGGTQNTLEARTDLLVRKFVGITAGVQVERWLIPQLEATAQKDVAGYIEVKFWPTRMGALKLASREGTLKKNAGQ